MSNVRVAVSWALVGIPLAYGLTLTLLKVGALVT